jgi:hypothetical protein
MLTGVPRHHLDTFWARVLPWLEAVEVRADGRETVADLRKWLDGGQLQLWIWLEQDLSVTGVLITEIIDQPRAKVCRLRVCTGRDPERWMPSVSVIEAWAKEQGCDGMEPIGRPGWGKMLAPLGYKVTHMVYWKPL